MVDDGRLAVDGFARRSPAAIALALAAGDEGGMTVDERKLTFRDLLKYVLDTLRMRFEQVYKAHFDIRAGKGSFWVESLNHLYLRYDIIR